MSGGLTIFVGVWKAQPCQPKFLASRQQRPAQERRPLYGVDAPEESAPSVGRVVSPRELQLPQEAAAEHISLVPAAKAINFSTKEELNSTITHAPPLYRAE